MKQMETKRKKDHIYNNWLVPAFNSEFSMQNSNERKFILNHCKLDGTIAKKQNNLLSFRSWKSGEIPRR